MKNRLPGLRKTIFVSLFFTTLHAASQSGSKVSYQQNEPKVVNQSSSKTKLRYVIINNGKTGFGYDILSDDRITIHQSSVPGMQGNKGFITKEDASKVARLVIEKINRSVFPPTITNEDVKALKIKTL
jgi:hypothetical protein